MNEAMRCVSVCVQCAFGESSLRLRYSVVLVSKQSVTGWRNTDLFVACHRPHRWLLLVQEHRHLCPDSTMVARCTVLIGFLVPTLLPSRARALQTLQSCALGNDQMMNRRSAELPFTRAAASSH